MERAAKTDALHLLRNRIDITTVPFTDRGSRLLVFAERDRPHFYIRLCERWPKLEDAQGHYRVRPPILSDLALLNGEGHPLPFTLVTYPHLIEAHTCAGIFRLMFGGPELLVLLPPPGRVGIRFLAGAEWGQADRRGGRFKGIRNIAYTTNAHILRNLVMRAEDRWQVELIVEAGEQAAITLNLTPRLGFDRQVPRGVLERAEATWRAWFGQTPPVAAACEQTYYYAWWVMRAGLLSTRYHLTREALVPSKVHYVGVWQWDAFFHALAYRHVDPQLACDQCRVVLDHQRLDGMLPDAVFDEGTVGRLTHPVHAAVTKPPVAAWVVWRIYEASGEREFLEEVYEPLCQWNRWWFTHDIDGDGIPQYDHPFSSGLDDSPLWDDGLPVESPDLATYLVIDMEHLAKIAGAIGEIEEARRWMERSAALSHRLVEHFYDEASGVFWAVRPGTHARIPVLTPFNLYPLWTGRLPGRIAARLVEHLTDSEKFWTRYPIPTVAKSDPTYNPSQMWRGPTWVNINYIFVDALRRAGYRDVARTLADRTLEMVTRGPDAREYYHPETGESPAGAAPCFGWTAALFVDLAIQRSRGLV
ncbi:MAG: glycogen debranching protein [Armatimonadetes bacterium]|nr:glycogen debranching protein [Armatimonadota bacterium]